MLTFDLCQRTTPIQCHMKENFMPNMVICDISPNTNFEESYSQEYGAK